MTRQQTLRATLAWSFELLEDGEQVLLRRLAVFAGAFGLEAAEDVVAEDPLRRSEAVAVLGRLIDKSLVHVEEGSEVRRYRLLETVRQYAVERLEEAGERSAFERRHRDWYVALAESDPTPAGDLPARTTLRGLDLERDNLRAALASALVADPQAALRLAVALWRFWLMRGYLAEGYRWLTAALAAAPEHTAVRARALLAACVIGLRRGVPVHIHEFAAESVAIFRELEDRAGMFDAVEISAAYRAIVSPARDVELIVREHEALIAEDLPAARPPMWAAHTRGIAAWLRCEYAPAREQLEAALEHAGALSAEPRPVLWPLSYATISVEPETGYPLFLHEDTGLIARRVGGAAAAGPVFYPGDRAEEVMRFYRDFARALPDELSTLVNLITAPPAPFLPEDWHGKKLVGLVGCYSGDPEEGMKAIQPIRDLGDPVADLAGPMPYVQMQSLLDALWPKGTQAYMKAGYFRELDDHAIATMARFHQNATSPSSEIHIQHFGGAIARVAEDQTACGERQAPFVLNAIAATHEPRGLDTHVDWAQRLYAEIEPSLTGGAYINFLSSEGEDRVQSAYGTEKFARLRALKDRYDPTNLFHLNQNIPPSKAG